MKRSTKEADEKMLTYNILNSVETQKKLKWRQALRIATQNLDPLSEIQETRSQRQAGRPAKRWEEVLNYFVKDEETEATQSDDLRNNNSWLYYCEEHL